ncbi:MAG: nucleotide-binding universal stress UspA family protein [Rickettsiales bacterium]|jgi:nucleotide-binding universal stress UspA family protein
MKKILVATDLSAGSDRAVLRAVKLAQEFDAQLTIAHVINGKMKTGVVKNAKKSAEEEINFCLKEIKTSNLEIEIKICVGNAYAEILNVIEKSNPNLVILGLHGHVDNDHYIIGSVTERLMRNSHKPLLIVKDRFEKAYNDVLIALDFNAHSKKSLEVAFKLFGGSKFHLLHSYEIPFLGFAQEGGVIEKGVSSNSIKFLREMADDLLKDFKGIKPKIEKIVKKGYIMNVLNEEVKILKPGLLVIGTHKKSGIIDSIATSPTDDILVNPPCDVLIVNNLT